MNSSSYTIKEMIMQFKKDHMIQTDQIGKWNEMEKTFEKIDPSLEIYSWIISNKSQYPVPNNKLTLCDYTSYISNTLMIKKALNIEPCKMRFR